MRAKTESVRQQIEQQREQQRREQQAAREAKQQDLSQGDSTQSRESEQSDLPVPSPTEEPTKPAVSAKKTPKKGSTLTTRRSSVNADKSPRSPLPNGGLPALVQDLTPTSNSQPKEKEYVPLSEREIKMGPDLEFRLRAIEDVLGVERCRQLKELILREKKKDRTSLVSEEKKLLSKLAILEDTRAQFEEQAKADIAQISSLTVEVNEAQCRVAELERELEATTADLAKKTSLAAKLKDGNVQLHNSLAEEEAAKTVALEKARKLEKELKSVRTDMQEVVDARNELDREKSVLMKRNEELREQHEASDRHAQRCEEELKKKDGELRVARRNATVHLPLEIKKVAERAKELEIEKKRATLAKEQSDNAVVEQKAELRKALVAATTAKMEKGHLEKKVADLEKQLSKCKSELSAERRGRQADSQRLISKTVDLTHSLHHEEDARLRSALQAKNKDEELSLLRRKHISVLGGLQTLEEEKARAEAQSASAGRTARMAREKLELLNSLQSAEFAKLRFSSATENEVDRLFAGAPRPPRTGKARSVSSSRAGARGSFSDRPSTAIKSSTPTTFSAPPSHRPQSAIDSASKTSPSPIQVSDIQESTTAPPNDSGETRKQPTRSPSGIRVHRISVTSDSEDDLATADIPTLNFRSTSFARSPTSPRPLTHSSPRSPTPRAMSPLSRMAQEDKAMLSGSTSPVFDPSDSYDTLKDKLLVMHNKYKAERQEREFLQSRTDELASILRESERDTAADKRTKSKYPKLNAKNFHQNVEKVRALTQINGKLLIKIRNLENLKIENEFKMKEKEEDLRVQKKRIMNLLMDFQSHGLTPTHEG